MRIANIMKPSFRHAAWVLGCSLLAACGGGGGGGSPAPVPVPVPVTLAAIAAAPTAVALTAGGTKQLTVTGTYSDGSTKAVSTGLTFASDNAAAASVSSAGLVTAVAAGTAHITVKATSVTPNLTAPAVTVTVTAGGGGTATLTSIAATPATVPLAVGGTQQLTVTGTYSDASTKTVTTGLTFTSGNTAVATVSGTGLVTAVAAGTAQITVTDTSVTPNISAPPVSVTVSVPANALSVTVDQGPTGLTSTNTVAANILYASVKVCAPGSSTQCQTIDHVQIDTGSVGLQIVSQALNSSVVLPAETASGAPLRECVQFADGYTWGSMVTADVTIGSRSLAAFPVHLIGDTAAGTAPTSCSSGAGPAENTVATFGANAILGIGNFLQDCGSYCVTNAPPALYYSCPTATTCTSSTASLAQQLNNPVGLMSADNNGVIVDLPAVTPPGAATVTGTVYFGIGTQADNAFASTATMLELDPNNATLATTFNGTTQTGAVIDSGSNAYFFTDSSLTACTSPNTSYYCPASDTALSASIQGVTYNSGTNTDTASGPALTVPFTIGNATTLFTNNPSDAVFPTLGGPNGSVNGVILGFDWGLPFFYGRKVYVLFEQNTLSTTTGPAIGF